MYHCTNIRISKFNCWRRWCLAVPTCKHSDLKALHSCWCCNNRPYSIPTVHSSNTYTTAPLFELRRKMCITPQECDYWTEHLCYNNKRLLAKTRNIIWEWWSMCILKSIYRQTYLVSCLPCNRPDPSTVSTAPFRVLLRVLIKDTWAVCSFFIWMLSPPSICGIYFRRCNTIKLYLGVCGK